MRPRELDALPRADRAPVLRGRVVVVSPHCDDAVLSLGAVLAGTPECTVLTVLAGAPASGLPAGPWDRRAGFSTADDATRTRRAEDVRACAAVGATPVHLDGTDEQYPDTLDDDALWQRTEPVLAAADELLVPGWPLRHPDHRRVTALVLARLPADRPVRLYLEEPYASWTRTAAELPADPWAAAVRWASPELRRRDVVRGLRGARCYRSQLDPLADSLRHLPRTPARRLLRATPAGLLLELARSVLLRGAPVGEPVTAARLRSRADGGGLSG